jgi:hypothetical protein
MKIEPIIVIIIIKIETMLPAHNVLGNPQKLGVYSPVGITNGVKHAITNIKKRILHVNQ